MTIKTFSQHGKREQSMLYATDLSIEGVQKPIKIDTKKSGKVRKNKHANKSEKVRTLKTGRDYSGVVGGRRDGPLSFRF